MVCGPGPWSGGGPGDCSRASDQGRAGRAGSQGGACRAGGQGRAGEAEDHNVRAEDHHTAEQMEKRTTTVNQPELK